MNPNIQDNGTDPEGGDIAVAAVEQVAAPAPKPLSPLDPSLRGPRFQYVAGAPSLLRLPDSVTAPSGQDASLASAVSEKSNRACQPEAVGRLESRRHAHAKLTTAGNLFVVRQRTPSVPSRAPISVFALPATRWSR